MNKAAVFHRTYSEYSFAISTTMVVLRLRAAKGDLTRCTVFYGDRMDPHTPIPVTACEMQCKYSDALFDYYEAVISPGVTRLCYFFQLFDPNTSVFYYNDGFFEKPDLNRQLYYNFHYIRKEDIPDVPDWARGSVVYQIYPDSFASEYRRISGQAASERQDDGNVSRSLYGGTLKGIYENIDYFVALGIDCLYLTPVFRSSSWHKYDTADYFDIDPCLGTKEDLRKLVSICHHHGIRVILDGVFNHSGPAFFAFRDLLDKGETSSYRDWFFPESFPVVNGQNPNYECFAYVGDMPKLNTGNPEVLDYFISVGKYWIEEFDIDGWRLDVANEVDQPFWRKFREAIKPVKQDALLIAEIWDDARAFLGGDQFDSAMNYNLYFACIEFFAKGSIMPQAFSDRVEYLLIRYKSQIQQLQLNLIGSHDVPRFLSLAGDDKRKLILAALFLMTHVGIPMLYYGDEKGLGGLEERDYRRPMLWDGLEAPLLSVYRRLILLRKQCMDAMLGEYRVLFADDSCYAYERRGEVHSVVVLLNNSDQTLERRVPVKGQTASDFMSGQAYPVEKQLAAVKLQAYSGAVIVN